MTILSANLKTIRKSLGCTQTAISKVVDIGFRTYVRYEAGERDAPVSILIKFSRLGNVSLDRLLTTELTPDDLKTSDADIPPVIAAKLDVIGGSLEEGRLMFKGVRNDYLICSEPMEKNLIEMFRKVDRTTKGKIILDAEWMIKNYLKVKGKAKFTPKKLLQDKTRAKLKKVAKTIKKITLRG